MFVYCFFFRDQQREGDTRSLWHSGSGRHRSLLLLLPPSHCLIPAHGQVTQHPSIFRGRPHRAGTSDDATNEGCSFFSCLSFSLLFSVPPSQRHFLFLLVSADPKIALFLGSITTTRTTSVTTSITLVALVSSFRFVKTGRCLNRLVDEWMTRPRQETGFTRTEWPSRAGWRRCTRPLVSFQPSKALH